MRAHVWTRSGMHQSATVLVRCVPGSSLLPPPYWEARRPWGRGWLVAFFKEVTFRLRYALGMRQTAPNGGIRNASWDNGDYMFVWHDLFSTATSRLCLRSSSIDDLKLWVWIKILFIELLLVLRILREQPCCWLCIVYLFSYSAIIQVSA